MDLIISLHGVNMDTMSTNKSPQGPDKSVQCNFNKVLGIVVLIVKITVNLILMLVLLINHFGINITYKETHSSGW